MSAGLRIYTLGGYCPVQGEGTFDGEPFYFRARGQHWSLGVGADPVSVSMGLEEGFSRQEPWGDGPYDAGSMPTSEARSIIRRCYDEWRATPREGQTR